MVKFIVKRLASLVVTMLLVSIVIYVIVEISPGDIAKNVLGIYTNEEQQRSFLEQHGLDEPIYLRYLFWLLGSDWYAMSKIGLPLKQIKTDKGFIEWWAVREDGSLIRWELKGKDLIAYIRDSSGNIISFIDNGRWKKEKRKEEIQYIFYGLNKLNRAVLWNRDIDKDVWTLSHGGNFLKSKGGAEEYIPLKKGILRGDPGISLKTGEPTARSLLIRLRNSSVLAGITFIFVMPLAVLLGLIAALKEGSIRDRMLSVGGMTFSVIPEFANGIFLIFVFSIWLGIIPGAAVFAESKPWQRLDMLILPVLTLSLTELGYILRITRASMVEVMDTSYVRTAILKGLPYWQVVFVHALRNALIAPVTVIMLHTRYLVAGLVVVEAVFSYPGLGTYLLDACLYKDVNVIEAATMVMVLICVAAQLIADIIYMFLNPRIRYE